jgi:hypothetical protein
MTYAQPKPEAATEFEADEIGPIDRDNPPSWFARTYGDASAKEMADQYRSNRPLPQQTQPLIAENALAYEAYRKRLEDRFSSAQRNVDPQFIPQDNDEAAFPRRPTYVHGVKGHAPSAVRQTSALGINPVTLGLLAIVACGIGGGAGYLGANPERASQLVANGLALVNGLWPAKPAAVTETVITKKTITTAKLEVNDAEGAVNSPIALDISALAADAETPVALRISGLPPAAYLTKGVEVSEGEWMLKATEIAQAELVVPYTDSPSLALQVSALEEKTGAPAAPAQDMRVKIDMTAVPVPGVPQQKTNSAVIMPASAVPDQGFNKVELPTAIPVPLDTLDPEAQSLMAKGERLLRDGDLLAARQFYLRAFEKNVPSAAFGVGQTYDPSVYAEHNIKGLTPSPQQAAEWYGKAIANGHEQATAALAALTTQN